MYKYIGDLLIIFQHELPSSTLRSSVHTYPSWALPCLLLSVTYIFTKPSEFHTIRCTLCCWLFINMNIFKIFIWNA